jgi:hypothetical protein
MAQPLDAAHNPTKEAPGPAPDKKATLVDIWPFLQPAFDHLFAAPMLDPSTPPQISNDYYSRSYNACYNYGTSTRFGLEQFRVVTFQPQESGLMFWNQLERYMSDIASSWPARISGDKDRLIPSIIDLFTELSIRSRPISRILAWIDRYAVVRARDVLRIGWFGIDDLDEAEAAKITRYGDGQGSYFRSKRAFELKDHWGVGAGVSASEAEASAEAGSPPGRVIHTHHLVFRHFRIEVVEPLLVGSSSDPDATDGRLFTAAREFMDSTNIEASQKRETVQRFDEVLKKIGIRPAHALRKSLEAFLSSSQ